MASRTNFQVVAATLLLLLASLAVGDRIPVRSGIGYDGVKYAAAVQNLSVSLLVDVALASRETRAAQDGGLDPYTARRILPSLVLHYVFQWLRLPASTPAIVQAFTFANILLLCLGIWAWCRAADELGIGPSGKWLGFSALVASYANLKMPIYYPVLTDTSAFAIGSGSLIAWLRGRRATLGLLTLAGAFTWPTQLYFGALLLTFPRAELQEEGPTLRVAMALAGLAGLAGFMLTSALLGSEYELPTTPVQPLAGLRYTSAAITGAYLFLALQPLLDSHRSWRELRPARVVCTPGFWAACAIFGCSQLVVSAISTASPTVNTSSFILETFYTSGTQPGVFWLAHVLFYGPALWLLVFAWPTIALAIQRQGPGLVACFSLAILLSVGSESRKLINFLPVATLFLALAAESAVGTPRRLLGLLGLSMVFSKAWLPMSRTLSLPWLGDVGWRELYVSSRGPWIDHGAYGFQLIFVALAAAMLWWWWRSAPAGR